jgi:hypothetical protein
MQFQFVPLKRSLQERFVMLLPRRKKTGHRHNSQFSVKIESCEIRSLLSAVDLVVYKSEPVTAGSSSPEERGDSGRESMVNVELGDVTTAWTEGEVAEDSEPTVANGSEFDQWYAANRDAILEAWSNAISGLDLNSLSDRPGASVELWNDTLRSLYGGPLPYDSESGVEAESVVTEDVVRVDESVPVDQTVVETVGDNTASTVDLSYTTLRPVLYVYNELLADGGWGGVAFEIVETSSVVYDDAGELVSGAVLSDRLTGKQYVLPSEVTLVSERDLTRMLEYFGISEYRVEDGGRWVIPVSPDEGVGFLNRVWSLTYYDEIQSYLRSAGETSTEYFSSDDFREEVVLRSVDPSADSDLILVLPQTKVGINYETVTIGSDGRVDGTPIRNRNHSITDPVNLHSSDRNSHSGASSLDHGEDNLEHHDQGGDKQVFAEMHTRAEGLSFPRPQVASGLLKNDTAVSIAESIDAYLANAFPDTAITRSGNVAGSQSLRRVGGLTASGFGDAESGGSRAPIPEMEGVPSLSLMNEYQRASALFPQIVNTGLNVLSERTSQLWPSLSIKSEQATLALVSSARVNFNAAPATSMSPSGSQVSSFSGMVKEERNGINGGSSATLTSARRQEFDQEASSHAGSSTSARYERIFRLLQRYWKALKARYSGARVRAGIEPADEVIIPEMELQNGLSAQIAIQRLRYILVARGPPSDDLPPDPEWIIPGDGSDQLNRLRHVITPRGPSPDSALQQVQVFSPFGASSQLNPRADHLKSD